jgi:GT2 family glycosyltransferase
MDLSVIFVNWNSADYLREAVASIRQHTEDISIEMIVVDNASPRGDAELLEREVPGIVLIKSAQNLGFAGANNLGFRHSSGRTLLFLNPDTKLISPALGRMLQRLDTLPDAGVVGCTLLNGDLSLQTSCIQTFPTILNQALDNDFLRRRWPNCRLWGTGPLFREGSEPADVEVISGACLMMKRDVFERVGGFTEDYFMYAEDLDLCYKVHRAGYRNYYLNEVRVIHYGGKSSEPLSATRMKWTAIPRFCDRHYGRLYGQVFRVVMALVALGRLSLLAILSLGGKRNGKKQALQHASAKWKLILKTLLTSSPADKNPVQRTCAATNGPGCEPIT